MLLILFGELQVSLPILNFFFGQVLSVKHVLRQTASRVLWGLLEHCFENCLPFILGTKDFCIFWESGSVFSNIIVRGLNFLAETSSFIVMGAVENDWIISHIFQIWTACSVLIFSKHPWNSENLWLFTLSISASLKESCGLGHLKEKVFAKWVCSVAALRRFPRPALAFILALLSYSSTKKEASSGSFQTDREISFA